MKALIQIVSAILFIGLLGCEKNADSARFEPWAVICSDDGRFATTNENGRIYQLEMFDSPVEAEFFITDSKRRFAWHKAFPGKAIPGTIGETIDAVKSRHWSACPNPKP